jgi:hypothetical protein
MNEEMVVARFETGGEAEAALHALRAVRVHARRVSIIATDDEAGEGPRSGNGRDLIAVGDEAGLPWARLWCLLPDSAWRPSELLLSFVVLGFLVPALAKHVRHFHAGRLLTPIGEALLGLGIPLDATRTWEQDLLEDKTLLLVKCGPGQRAIVLGTLEASRPTRLERHPIRPEERKAC